ncbi:uncharacterized membrane protein YcaP (DUF421 family) [Bacillus pakistanensis]|uniref:Uncharacterized membrane protein YcaP (DUF421 family) n=1 Tax=Rossellomorea pakistanensis TaxID=992288 RepID=A0ABS2NFD0_9BACI|nr:DUF421 domain-containing protein [Bacillus pakistanensis]MBM7586560.1 uncharacterized membrane protein YcaP (DUF421 family) [Bacillus pakistanensis]
MDLFGIAIELTIGFVALLLLTKILGKTQITQITAFDFISALILGELVGNSLYDGKTGVKEILFAIIIWGGLIYLTEHFTQRYRRFRHVLEGTPAIVIHKGKINFQQLKKNHLDLNQLQHLLRAKDIFSVRECEFAFLEPNGSLSVVKKSMFELVKRQDLNLKPSKVTIPIALIMDGEIIYDNLKIIDANKEWLMEEIKKHGFHSAKEVLFAEWEDVEGFFIQSY